MRASIKHYKNGGDAKTRSLVRKALPLDGQPQRPRAQSNFGKARQPTRSFEQPNTMSDY